MLQLPRLQLFEFNDLEATPAALRDSVIEILGRVLDESGAIAATIPILERLLAESGCQDVLDVCAGAGGPAEVICREMRAAGKTPPHILETDLFPRIAAWERAQRTAPEHIGFVRESIDATNIPSQHSEGRARVIYNAMHHFPPPLATAILRAAVDDGAPILVVEGFERDPLGFAVPFGLPALGILLSNPFVSPKQRLQKALLTYFTPLVAAAGAWDGVVSTLRVYTEDEFRRMVAPFGDGYRWEFGRYDFKRGGRGTYFMGLPA